MIEYYEVCYFMKAYEDGEHDYDSHVGFFTTEEAARIVAEYHRSQWPVLEARVRKITVKAVSDPKQFLLDVYHVAYDNL